MTESRPLIPEEDRQLNRSLTEKVLERAANDPQWKQRLLDDPEGAMREADFPEIRRIEEMHRGAQAATEGAVRGQELSDDPTSTSADYHPCPWYCRYFTWRWFRTW